MIFLTECLQFSELIDGLLSAELCGIAPWSQLGEGPEEILGLFHICLQPLEAQWCWEQSRGAMEINLGELGSSGPASGPALPSSPS